MPLTQLPWLAHLIRRLNPAPAPCGASCARTADLDAPSWTSLPARPRLPLPLVRVLGAQCPLCNGLGCEDCAYTGLR